MSQFRLSHLLPQALSCATLIQDWDLQFEAAARLLHQTGYYLDQRGRYTEAEALFEQALAIRQIVLPLNHPDIATSFLSLGGVYQSQGKYAEAAPLYEQAIAIDEKILGPEHLHVAQDINNLALLYKSKGEYIQAEPLYHRSLCNQGEDFGTGGPGRCDDPRQFGGTVQSPGQARTSRAAVSSGRWDPGERLWARAPKPGDRSQQLGLPLRKAEKVQYCRAALPAGADY